MESNTDDIFFLISVGIIIIFLIGLFVYYWKKSDVYDNDYYEDKL